MFAQKKEKTFLVPSNANPARFSTYDDILALLTDLSLSAAPAEKTESDLIPIFSISNAHPVSRPQPVAFDSFDVARSAPLYSYNAMQTLSDPSSDVVETYQPPSSTASLMTADGDRISGQLAQAEAALEPLTNIPVVLIAPDTTSVAAMMARPVLADSNVQDTGAAFRIK